MCWHVTDQWLTGKLNPLCPALPPHPQPLSFMHSRGTLDKLCLFCRTTCRWVSMSLPTKPGHSGGHCDDRQVSFTPAQDSNTERIPWQSWDEMRPWKGSTASSVGHRPPSANLVCIPHTTSVGPLGSTAHSKWRTSHQWMSERPGCCRRHLRRQQGSEHQCSEETTKAL